VAVLQEVRELTQRSLGEVDKCIGELSAQVEELTKYLRETVEMLQKDKREIEASLQEVEATITEEQPELRLVYGKAMRAYLDRKSTFLELFEYRVNAFDPKGLLDIRNQRYSCYQSQHFPCIFGNTLRLYDFVRKESRFFTLSTTFTNGTVFCLLDASNVLCTGGHPASTSVSSLNLTDQKLTAFPNLTTARSFPGVVKVGVYAYVFGCYQPQLASCEKLAVNRKVWEGFGNMSAARWVFSPAVHIDDIYLARVSGHRSIEVFNTGRETFRTLPFLIPASISDNRACFVVAGEFYILGTGQVATWKINSTEEMQTFGVTGDVSWSNGPAFVAGSEVLLVNYDNGLLCKFNYVTKSVVS